MGLCETVEHVEFLRACIVELTDPTFNFREWEQAALKIPALLATDVKSVYDNVTAERGVPSDRMLALDLAALRETFQSQLREDVEQRNANLVWVPGSRNIPDGLTKYLAVSDLIISALSTGKYSVADDSTVLARAAALKEANREKQKQAKRQQTLDTTRLPPTSGIGNS